MTVDDTLPDDNTAYKTKTYWDERYAKCNPSASLMRREADKTFDWFKDYAPLREIFRQFIPDPTASIVMLGCGNSLLSEQMYDDGYTGIFNVDFSEIVIENMRKRCADRPEMTCTLQ